MVFISASVILFCAYMMIPSFADRLKTAYLVIVHNKTDDTIVSKKKIIPILERRSESETDTASNFKEPAKSHRIEIIESSFMLKSYANGEVRKLKGKGIAAKIIADDDGPLLRVSAGTYDNPGAAKSALDSLLRTGKINKNSYIKVITTPK